MFQLDRAANINDDNTARSVALLTDTTLDYLISNLDLDKPPPVNLFSLIALEKFSQTSKNKVTISKRLGGDEDTSHPLLILEQRHLLSTTSSPVRSASVLDGASTISSPFQKDNLHTA